MFLFIFKTQLSCKGLTDLVFSGYILKVSQAVAKPIKTLQQEMAATYKHFLCVKTGLMPTVILTHCTVPSAMRLTK